MYITIFLFILLILIGLSFPITCGIYYAVVADMKILTFVCNVLHSNEKVVPLNYGDSCGK